MGDRAGGCMTAPFVIHHGECLEVLRTLPDCSVVTDLAAGTAAEHLVCADLLLQGYKAFLTNQICAYDVVVDVGGRLIRIQVKATRETRAIPQRVNHYPAYRWHVKRAGKKGLRAYGNDEFELLALVAIDARLIAYMPPGDHKQTICIRPEDDRPQGVKKGKKFSDFTFSKAIQAVLL